MYFTPERIAAVRAADTIMFKNSERYEGHVVLKVVYLPHDLDDKLRRLAESAGLSRDSLIRLAISDIMDELEKVNLLSQDVFNRVKSEIRNSEGAGPFYVRTVYLAWRAVHLCEAVQATISDLARYAIWRLVNRVEIEINQNQ